MNCKTFEVHFDALLEGTLSSAVTSDCMQHLNECPSCSDLKEFIEDPLEPSLDPAKNRPPANLVNSVLNKTSGPTCERAQLLIGDLVDGNLSRADLSLVRTHMAECLDCNALGSICVEVLRDLPLLAELKPDSTLIDDVLAATLPASTRIRRWWSERWPQMLLRPRFALEAAYIGTLALVLVLNTSGTSLEAMPQKALAATRSHPIAHLQGSVSAVEHHIVAKIEPAWRLTREQAVGRLTKSAQLARGALDTITEKAGTLTDGFASLLERPDASEPLEPAEASGRFESDGADNSIEPADSDEIN